MKITKKQLITILKPELDSIGFKFFRDSLFQGTFIMKTEDKLFLTLSIIIDRYYDSMFTGSYYLSPTTENAATWGDIPKDSYVRIARCLTEEELVQYSKNNDPKVKDLWWNGFNQLETRSFIEIVKLTYKRFSSNQDLKNRINQSQDVKELVKLSQETINIFNLSEFSSFLEFQPNKELDGVPFNWFKSAETVIRKEGYLLNKNTVRNLAADAYRQYCFMI